MKNKSFLNFQKRTINCKLCKKIILLNESSCAFLNFQFEKMIYHKLHKNKAALYESSCELANFLCMKNIHHEFCIQKIAVQ